MGNKKTKLGKVIGNHIGYNIRMQMHSGKPNGKVGIYNGKKLFMGDIENKDKAMDILKEMEKENREMEKELRKEKLENIRRKLSDKGDKRILDVARSMGFSGNRKEMKQQIKKKIKEI